MDMFDVVV